MPDILYLMAFKETPKIGPVSAVDYEKDLHITILPNFAVSGKNFSEMRRTFQAISPWFTQPVVKAHANAELGTAVKIPAALVENITGDYLLHELHETFVEAVHNVGGYFCQYEFIEENFLPHVSYWHGFGSMDFEAVSLMYHTTGFGKDVVNLANYYFS